VSGYNKSRQLWANGESDSSYGYLLNNSDYDYLTLNGYNADDPATAYIPVIGTNSLTVKTQIFPFAGSRNPSGVTANLGTYGHYWSGVTFNPTNGYEFIINNNSVRPVLANNPYAYGESIRCVRI
jgi:hypothetical protein